MSTLFHQFLGESSIHGVRYWGGGSSTAKARVFWVVVTLTGCFLTVTLLFHLISDWSSYPTYTTIDSSAVPIDTVPFPSVTVCQGDGSGHPAPSGGFGFIRKALNNYKMYNLDENYAFVKTQFAKDFDSYLDFTGNLYLEKLMTYLRRTDVDIQKEVEKLNFHKVVIRFGYHKYSALGKELLCKNITSANIYIELLSEKAFSEQPSLFHGVVKSFQTNQLRNVDQASCYNDIEPILIASYYLLTSTRNIGEFGTLLAIVAPLIGPSHSFKNSEWKESPGCDEFGQLELKLHETFVGIASRIGIPLSNNNRSISLFELPSILESDGKPLSSPKSWMTKYPHYACQRSDRFKYGFWYDELPCLSAWEHYILDGEDIAAKHNKQINLISLDKDTKPPTFPCDIDEHECCPMQNAGHVNLTSVMIVMKFAIRRGQSYFDVDQIDNLLPEFSKYENVPNPMQSFELDKKYVPDMETYIPYCSIDRLDNSKIISTFSSAYGPSTCMSFTPIVTNMGICYGFNARHPKDMLKIPSPFHDSIMSAYEPELEHFKDPVMAFSGQNGQGLTFYLDKQKVLSTNQFGGGLVTDNGHFRIGINTILNSFNVKSHVTNARIGHKLEILVSVKELTVSDEVRSLSIEARKCRMMNEVPQNMTMFSYYTQDLCYFECSLKFSRKKCGCTPWNYPFQPDDDIKICDHYGKYCFEYFLQDQEHVKKECDCLPDCERLTYSFTEKELPLDTEALCSPGKSVYAYINYKMSSWAHDKFYSSLLSLLHNNTANLSRTTIKNDVTHTCAKIVHNDLAAIEVRMASSVYERSQIRLKQTFADKVSGFGGTLGLFVGASFTTLVEVCYWVARIVFGSRICQRTKRRGKNQKIIQHI